MDVMWTRLKNKPFNEIQERWTEQLKNGKIIIRKINQ